MSLWKWMFGEPRDENSMTLSLTGTVITWEPGEEWIRDMGKSPKHFFYAMARHHENCRELARLLPRVLVPMRFTDEAWAQIQASKEIQAAE